MYPVAEVSQSCSPSWAAIVLVESPLLLAPVVTDPRRSCPSCSLLRLVHHPTPPQFALFLLLRSPAVDHQFAQLPSPSLPLQTDQKQFDQQQQPSRSVLLSLPCSVDSEVTEE
ncbi:hypothetical protein SAY87_001127 [Trapa incisa]|uniref:Uncharacterized protein n=1 Tax=Trapa incisa TaxID=236973 RepID=A0AAN7GD53_9MYRT|nr:hypothetical protein SAY87_001127 [Trapa incisa]